MFPDFSQLGKGIDSLNEKFDRIIELLEIIARQTAPDTTKEESQS